MASIALLCSAIGLLGGGIFGYVKTSSLMSLIASAIISSIYAAAFFLKHETLGLGGSIVLLILGAVRYVLVITKTIPIIFIVLSVSLIIFVHIPALRQNKRNQ